MVARIATAACDRHYFDRGDVSGNAARAAVTSLRATGEPTRDAWTALALRSARDAGIPTDEEVKRKLLVGSGDGDLGASCHDLAARLVTRSVLLREVESDPPSARLRAELLSRADEALSDPETTWFASIGFYQRGRAQWERWSSLMKPIVTERRERRQGDDERVAATNEAWVALSAKLYFRYSASVGAR